MDCEEASLVGFKDKLALCRCGKRMWVARARRDY